MKYSKANAKTQALANSAVSNYLTGNRKIYSFDILSGWSCPYADECLSKVHMVDGKRFVRDGKNTQFRCFSASQETLFPAVYNSRKANFDAIRGLTKWEIADKLVEALPNDTGIVRIHVAGDMYSQEYFDAWIIVANCVPSVLFYAYTKSLPYWVSRLNDIPPNLVLTASYGGRRDNMIAEYGLRSARVVFSEAEAKKLKLQIDTTDIHAANPATKNNDFALLIHGQQPKGSKAQKAWQKIKSTIGGYSR